MQSEREGVSLGATVLYCEEGVVGVTSRYH
jgi:hypothetical protein